MNSRGVILIIALWILAILMVFVVSLGFRMSLEVKLTDYSVGELRNLYLTKAAVNKLKAILIEDDKAYDALGEDWSNNDELFKNQELGEGIYTLSYTRTDGIAEKIFYGAMDEESKININTADRETLVKLLELFGETEDSDDIADSILDWRDEDPDTTSPGGAESAHYLSLEFPYLCKDTLFQSKEELLLVKEMTPEILNNIKDLITVYGEDDKINVNTADSRVMRALGLSDDVVSDIIEHRAGDDDEEGTEDDNIFTKLKDITDVFTNLETEDLNIISNKMDFSSSRFRAFITARTKDGKIIKKVEAVISRPEGEEESGVLFWHEY